MSLPVAPVLKAQSHGKSCENISQRNHSRTSPEIQFEEMIEKLRASVFDQQINWTMPAKNTQSQKFRKPKIIKQTNKKYRKNLDDLA